MSGFEWALIGLIGLIALVYVLLAQVFPCPFGREKQEGFWDKAKQHPKRWVYVASIGGFMGLPGHWQLQIPSPDGSGVYHSCGDANYRKKYNIKELCAGMTKDKQHELEKL